MTVRELVGVMCSETFGCLYILVVTVKNISHMNLREGSTIQHLLSAAIKLLGTDLE